MKDEEIAEEYVRNKADKGNFDVEVFGRAYFSESSMEQAYLAGLKAGRPKWHKISDGDLPKEHKIYLVAIKDNGLAIAYFNGRHWVTKYNLGDFGHCVETVIAWCEIPKFKED